MQRSIVWVFAITCLFAAGALAQSTRPADQPGGHQPPQANDHQPPPPNPHQPPPPNAHQPPPLDQLFMPLRLAMQRPDELGLSDDQQQAIRDLTQKMQEDTSVAEADLANQTAALTEMVRQDKPDQRKVMAQLDKVLDDERTIKRARLQMALSVLDQLTPEQTAKLHEMMDKIAAAGPPPPMLRAKFEQAMNEMRQAHDNGADVQDIRPAVSDAQHSMEEGDYKAAEEKIDQALKMLSQTNADKK